jgi:hypothetical protein
MVYPSIAFFSGISPKKWNGKWESGYGRQGEKGTRRRGDPDRKQRKWLRSAAVNI